MGPRAEERPHQKKTYRWQVSIRKGAPHHVSRGMQLKQWDAATRRLERPEARAPATSVSNKEVEHLPHNPTIAHLDVYTKELKTCPFKSLHTDVRSSFIPNCQNLEAAELPFSG